MRSCQIQRNEKYMTSSALNISFVVASHRPRRRTPTRRLAGRIHFPGFRVWVEEDAHIHSGDPPVSKTSDLQIRGECSPALLNRRGSIVMGSNLLHGVLSQVGVRLVVLVVIGEAIVIADSRVQGSGLREKGMGGVKPQNQRFWKRISASRWRSEFISF